jgi:hypothetical protein
MWKSHHTIYYLFYTEWFKALVQCLRRMLGGLFGPENVNKIFFRFATVSELRRFCIDATFIIVIVDIYKMETIFFM